MNDAAVCVQEMQKRGEWVEFETNATFRYLSQSNQECLCDVHADYIAWLFNAENFFAAMAAYLKEGKK